jgi:hypothetical protein
MNGNRTRLWMVVVLAFLTTLAGVTGLTLSSDPEWRYLSSADVSDRGISLIELPSAREGASAVLFNDEADALFGSSGGLVSERA